MADTPESANQPSTNPVGGSSPSDENDPAENVVNPGAGEGLSGDSSSPFDASPDAPDRFQGPSFKQERGPRGPQEVGSSSSGGADSFGRSSSPLDGMTSALGLGPIPLQMAKSWVRDHQTQAMLGAFAVGVFIGAISRD